MEATNKPLRCFLIGADTLLVECAQHLLSAGHQVLGVVSSAAKIRHWATQQSIPCIASDGDYAQALQQHDFDYLFAITHLHVIPGEVLRLPRKGAVNFHDGPLPRYAGLNAPSWAIMAGEKEYAISWHELVEGVDQGNILQQVHFPIAADETSLSINTKCFAAALESFPALLNQLQTGQPVAQEQDLSQRSYFAKHKRPVGAGILDWQRSAIELEALVRGLNFGDYANPLVTPKLWLPDAMLSVTQAAARDQVASHSPGQIVALEEGQLDVATTQGIIALRGFSDAAGKPLSAGELQTRFGLRVGQLLGNIRAAECAPLCETLGTVMPRVARSEEYWCKRLAYLTPIELPYTQAETNDEPGAVNVCELPVDSQTIAELGAVPANKLCATFALLLARLNRFSDEQLDASGTALSFDLAYVHHELHKLSDQLEGVLAPYAVAHFNLDFKRSRDHWWQAAEQSLAESEKQLGWMSDIVVRHPELRALPELAKACALPLGMHVGDSAEHILGTVLTFACGEQGQVPRFYFDSARMSTAQADALAQQFATLLSNLISDAQAPLHQHAVLTVQEQRALVRQWNHTETDYDEQSTIHQLFEARVAEHPDATALVFEHQSLSYAELNRCANALAHDLVKEGVGIDTLVGVNVQRSLDLMVATLAVLKAGAAYVPLDPAFPSERIAYMVDDARVPLIITQTAIETQLPATQAKVLRVDEYLNAGRVNPAEAEQNLQREVPNHALAYVIYTSGSTGNPKGVMVEHRNATNFFVGMDQRIAHETPGTWMAVTSLSFDISVLELFWTLTRGFKVVIYREDRSGDTPNPQQRARRASQQRPMAFGLFMWGNDDAPGRAKYNLMLEGAKYFDDNGFDSVWTPERHFGAFGGPYPNPAVTCSALAAVTQNVAIRSGSIVSPLHHPVRIAEDWAVIDNLSDGRVGLSFAAGWQPNDFVIMPQNHANNKQIMLEQIDTVKRLWRGEAVEFANPMGTMVPTQTLPRPVQAELPVWLTTAGNPETYRQAGELGLNVLTHLLGQSVEELSEKIRIYRQARKDAGHDPDAGQVTLMLHTFVGQNDDQVREWVRQPMKDYLRSAMKLVLDFAWAFPAFKRPGGADAKPDDINIKDLSAEETDTILDFAFERYFEQSGLFGTVATCMKMIDRCKAAGVDEIACLLDFGVATERVMQSLPQLKQLRDMANIDADAARQVALDPAADDLSIAAQMQRHGVTHFQCTPSMARMLCFDDAARDQLGKLSHMMVGGEAFPQALAKDLKQILQGRLTNMYGPTETTIWSTTHDVDDPSNIPIGRPIANTDIYILDAQHQPVPVGVPGDLYIGGKGVVRGYLNRPELTAERFIAHPLAALDDGAQSERIYWTGDLARYREDGVIEFLGRIDHQVKIRGYRIELGEIEALLSSHPAIDECVLLLREDSAGDQRLVAYVVPAQVGAPLVEATQLRDFLRARLPEYMVPNDIVSLPEMPLTPNGKLDRKQLPAPQAAQKNHASPSYIAPKDDTQRLLVEIWQTTLQLDRVGVNDNFFDLGGHSLLIVKVHQLLKERVQKPLSLTDLYRFPTIAALADYLKADTQNASLKKSSDRASRRRERMGLKRRGRRT